MCSNAENLTNKDFRCRKLMVHVFVATQCKHVTLLFLSGGGLGTRLHVATDRYNVGLGTRLHVAADRCTYLWTRMVMGMIR